MLRFLFLMLVSLSLLGCATGDVVVQNDVRIDAPKVVALDAPLEPWVPQIEKRLKQHGFQVKRLSPATVVPSTVNYRYVLRVGGGHYRGWAYRCFGGGFDFQELTAELVDTQSDEAIASVSGSGYSEDCPPASGTIFGDIARMVADRWR